jgi:hypothetical protein
MNHYNNTFQHGQDLPTSHHTTTTVAATTTMYHYPAQDENAYRHYYQHHQSQSSFPPHKVNGSIVTSNQLPPFQAKQFHGVPVTTDAAAAAAATFHSNCNSMNYQFQSYGGLGTVCNNSDNNIYVSARPVFIDVTNTIQNQQQARSQQQNLSFFSQKSYVNPFVPLQACQVQSQQPKQATGIRKPRKKRSVVNGAITRKMAPAFSSETSFMSTISDGEEDACTSPSTSTSPTESDIEKSYATQCDCIAEIFDYLRKNETKNRASPTYMTDVQNDVKDVMRSILVDWLVEVCFEFHLLPETLYLAVGITDRALTKIVIPRKKLQMIGVTSLFIAAKYFEMEPPSVEEFVFITDNTYRKDEILQMESHILNCLEFNLTVVTCYDFLDHFLKASGANDLVSDLAHFLSELTLQDYVMLSFLPSTIAASCVTLALFSLNSPNWTPILQKYTGYRGPELSDCIAAILRLYQELDSSPLSAIKAKYSQENKNCVALYPCCRAFDYSSLSI